MPVSFKKEIRPVTLHAEFRRVSGMSWQEITEEVHAIGITHEMAYVFFCTNGRMPSLKEARYMIDLTKIT